jgi:hypothetical protein
MQPVFIKDITTIDGLKTSVPDRDNMHYFIYLYDNREFIQAVTVLVTVH